ncbi:putative sporulation protein YtxC [Clostridium fermenticellae]|uniref:Putative sporulation protein YtxC n=1 Tax=Clostridium fermenticellae TaxID=2068654 RepID=A0A386H294_9CLOT|nr:putative sporulation protein YtxC [Clostridium fermenticellae]AYD39774.1 putative sporulation protein YtxC [Clostridium fermenticellae]
MLLLTVVYDDKREDLIYDIENVVRYFKEKNFIMGISENIQSNTHFVKVFCDGELSEKVYNLFNMNVAGIIYNIVINEFCDKHLFELLSDTYFFLGYDEIDQIMKNIKSVLKGYGYKFDQNSIYCMNKKNMILDKIADCIRENNEININGFIRFRMNDLQDDLESIVDKIVEQYMVEKEYNDFIKLLKYFVEIQESRIDEIDIVITEYGKYLLRDATGKDITRELLMDLDEIQYKQNSNEEDVIIGILITNCPKNIVIHGMENIQNEEFIGTIKNIFKDRVKICEVCDSCSAVEDKCESLFNSKIKN